MEQENEESIEYKSLNSKDVQTILLLDGKTGRYYIDRIAELENKFEGLNTRLEQNTILTQQISHNTEFIADVLGIAKVGGKVLTSLGFVAKWFMTIVSAIIVMYYIFRGKIPPING